MIVIASVDLDCGLSECGIYSDKTPTDSWIQEIGANGDLTDKDRGGSNVISNRSSYDGCADGESKEANGVTNFN